eukprot:scaffold56409_cov66-Phaeocystis_antarctica.AAC.2
MRPSPHAGFGFLMSAVARRARPRQGRVGELPDENRVERVALVEGSKVGGAEIDLRAAVEYQQLDHHARDQLARLSRAIERSLHGGEQEADVDAQLLPEEVRGGSLRRVEERDGRERREDERGSHQQPGERRATVKEGQLVIGVVSRRLAVVAKRQQSFEVAFYQRRWLGYRERRTPAKHGRRSDQRNCAADGSRLLELKARGRGRRRRARRCL